MTSERRLIAAARINHHSPGDGADPVDLRDRASIAIGRHTGFRRAEIATIEMDDLNPIERASVVIARRNKRNRVRVGEAC